jgi:shikimate dehydrogenase
LTAGAGGPETKRLAVLGHPVSHSRSPAMQSAALEALGLSDEWSYGAIDLDPAEFDERVRALPGEGYVGVNVTIPHKESALRVADEASEAAHQIGAANTLSFRHDLIRADNTDATGLQATLPERLVGRAALVLGAGGSARAAAWALAGKGASVSVWNRTATRADELVRDLAGTGVETLAEGRLAPISDDRARTGAFELIVNCSAIGMEDEDPFDHLPLDPDRLRAGVTVIDLVYAGSESRLVAEARSRGARTIDGLEILVRQGAESLRLWTGMDPPLDAMREAARRGSETDG